MAKEIAKTAKVIGPPGVGKTTYLLGLIEAAAQKYDPKRVGAVSFTVAAVNEMRDRVSRSAGISKNVIKNCRTIHSHCFRLLEMRKEKVADAKISEWNEFYPQWELPYNTGLNEDDHYDDVVSRNRLKENVKTFNRMQINRNRLIPVDKWPEQERLFYGDWMKWMFLNDYIDYTGMLEQTFKKGLMPDIDVLFIDEAQDLTPLQMAVMNKWSEQTVSTVFVGDADQCQPPGCMISLSNGEKPIELLDPQRDRIIVHSKHDAAFYGIRSKKYSFKKESRFYKGLMYHIKSGDKETRATDNHIWHVKWDNEAKGNRDINVVYLMQKGERFRIGWCQLFNSEKVLHLKRRSTLEKAEKVWILKVCDGKADASMYESFFATKYGLPLITFEPVEASNYITKEYIDTFFSMLDPVDQSSRAYKLLRSLDLNIKYPLIDKNIKKEYSASNSISQVRSCNLLPELMALPLVGDSPKENRKIPIWTKIKKIVKEPYEGIVYSLDTEKYHTYITDGIATHNCIFRFSGAAPETFLDLKHGFLKNLDQSYRVPKSVHKYAQDMIRQIQRRDHSPYKPTDMDGEIFYGLNEPMLDMDGTHMIIARCNYHLNRWRQSLTSKGLPWHNPYRPGDKSWNPTDTKLWRAAETFIRLRYGLSFTGLQLKNMVKEMVAKDNLVKGIKTSIDDLMVAPDAVLSIFDSCVSSCFLNVDESVKKPVKEVFNLKKVQAGDLIENIRDESQLMADPKIILGTIHSIKGGEASHVWIDTGTSRQCQAAVLSDHTAFEDEVRVGYVAVTRAKETLGFIRADGYSNSVFPMT